MKIIDEKGKLFGFINIIDLFIVVLVLAVIFVGVSIVRNRGQVVSVKQDKDIELTMIFRSVRSEYVSFFKVGDVVKRKETQGAIGEIVSVEDFPAETIEIDSEGKKVIAVSPRERDVKIVLKCKGRASSDMVATGNEIVKVGQKFGAITKWYEGEAIILSVKVI